MYTEFDRRTRLAEIEAEFYRHKELDGVRVREPNLLERGVVALVTALRTALARRLLAALRSGRRERVPHSDVDSASQRTHAGAVARE